MLQIYRSSSPTLRILFRARPVYVHDLHVTNIVVSTIAILMIDWLKCVYTKKRLFEIYIHETIIFSL